MNNRRRPPHSRDRAQAPGRQGGEGRSGPPASSGNEENWIWGLHSVEACIERFPELVLELQIEQAEPRDREAMALNQRVKQMAHDGGVMSREVPTLPRVLKEKRTQGVAAKLKNFPTLALHEFRDSFEERLSDTKKPPAQWVVLDGIQDPRNFGAILRSAAAFGVEGVFMRDRHQCPPTGVVAQASAGNMFRVPLIVCPTFNPIFEWISGTPHRVLGLEAGGRDLELAVNEAAREKATCLWVLGSEGSGIRPGLREKCTELVSIPMSEGVESLNASTAAAIAFYSGSRHMKQK